MSAWSQVPWKMGLAAMICGLGLQALHSQGASITVTTLADSGSGSLRAAIANANSGDTITFAVTGTITSLSGEIPIGKDLSIVGPGAANLAVSGNNASRVFNIAGGATVNLSGLTICNGHAKDGAAGTNSVTPGWPGTDGGGIYNSGTLGLTNCIITRCRSGQGGAGYNSSGFPLPPGGGPSTDGGPGGNGGGIYNAGTLTLAACTLSYNTNGSGGNGGNTRAVGYPGGAGASGGSGAGIYDVGTATLIACTFGFNSAGAGGTGGYGATGSETGSTDGAAGGRGGDGGSGGGLYSQSSPTFVSCTLAGNTGGSGGQGGMGGAGYSSPIQPIFPPGNGGPGADGGVGGSGGGLYCLGYFQSVACTITTNAAGKGANGGAGGRGGSSLRMAAGGNGGYGGNGGSGGAGGGAYSWAGSPFQNVLAAQNSVAAGGTGGAGGAGGTGYPAGSSGSPGASGSSGSGPDLLGAFTSNGYNLIGLGDGCSGFTDGVLGDIVGSGTPLNPVLGSLTNNGGSTFTCAVLCGSPALDTGDDTLLGAVWNLTTDQRGLPRQSGSHVDIGAYEVQRAACPIRVTACSRTTNGAIQMTVTNVPGASLTVLAATNPSSPPANWAALGLMPEIAPGQFQFVDPASTNLARRFYRLRCP